MATPPNFTTRRTVAGAMCCAPGRPSTPCRACFPTGPKREVRPRVCSGAACGKESPTCIGGPEVSQNANERLLNALASVDDSRSVEELTAQIQTHNHWGGRRVRGLRPWGEDKELLSAEAESPKERRRRSAAVSRKLRLLRAHGLIHKVYRTHRYNVAAAGRAILVAVLTTARTTCPAVESAWQCRMREIVAPGGLPHQFLQLQFYSSSYLISRISFSLVRAAWSILSMWVLVSFWISSWARLSSSSVIFLSLRSALTASLPSRRMLRTDTRWCSATPCRRLTNSLRRSSVRGGMGSRIILPSLAGFRPRSETRMAFSIGPICEASQGRMVAASCCRSPMSFSMRTLTLFSTSLMDWKAGPAGAAVCSVFISGLVNERTDGLAHRHTHYIAARVQIENNNRKLVVPAHGNGSGVHDGQRLGQDFQVRNFTVHHGAGELQGVLIVHSIHAGGFGDHLRADFQGAQGGGGVGREVRIRGAAGEDADAALFQMAQGASADVRLGHLVHLDGAHDPGMHADLFQGVLQRQGIDHGGEHAHVVGGHAIHVLGGGRDAAEDIAAAHHQPDLDAGGGYRGHFRGQLIDTRGVDAESGASGQRFAAELEHDSLILRHWRRAALRRRIRSRPRLPRCTG